MALERKKWLCLVCHVNISRKTKYCKPCNSIKSLQSALCVVCGKEFFRQKSDLKRSAGRFCSRACYLGGKWKDESNPHYKDGKKDLRKKIRDSKKNRVLIRWILERDNYTCKCCGQIGRKLEVDHRKKFSLIFEEFLSKNHKENDKYKLFSLAMEYKDFWEESNLQVLCKKCNWDKEVAYRIMA